MRKLGLFGPRNPIMVMICDFRNNPRIHFFSKTASVKEYFTSKIARLGISFQDGQGIKEQKLLNVAFSDC